MVDFLPRQKTRALLGNIEAETGVKWTESSEKIIMSGTLKQVAEGQKLFLEDVSQSNGIVFSFSLL